MAKIIEKTGKTVEDALKAALDELSLTANDIDYEIIEEPSNGFLGIIGKKMAKIRVTVREVVVENNNNSNNIENIASENENNNINNDSVDENDNVKEIAKQDNSSAIENFSDTKTDKIDIAEKFLQNVLDKMNLTVSIDVQNNEEEIILNVQGENLGLLIGKHGQTLDALQYIVNLVANKNESVNRHRFIVDVENYRNRRKEILQNLAKNLADKAIRMNQEVRLEPMNRHERKIIHSALQDNNKVITHSVGEDPHRYIIISPKNYCKSKKNNKTQN